MSKNKKLNMTNLKKLDYKFSETIPVIVDEQFDPIHINKSFRISLIFQLIGELSETIIKAKEQKIEIEKILPSYISLLVLKYFSDLQIPETLEKQIQFIDLLVDHGYFSKLMEAYDQNELQKLTNYIKEYKDNLPQMVEMIVKEFEKNNETAVEQVN